MKIGMVFECGPGGADIKVCEYLARQLIPDIEMASPTTLNNKKELIRESGKVAKRLLEIDQCDLVVIIWDLYPRWGEDLQSEEKKKPKDCELIKKDREKIEARLHSANLTEEQLQSVKLICIVKELESWLLADEYAIIEYLQDKRNKPCEMASFKHPERPQNPKGELHRIFKNHLGRKYEDTVDAEKIILKVEIKKLRKCATFTRFALKIAGERVTKRILGTQFASNREH